MYNILFPFLERGFLDKMFLISLPGYLIGKVRENILFVFCTVDKKELFQEKILNNMEGLYWHFYYNTYQTILN